MDYSKLTPYTLSQLLNIKIKLQNVERINHEKDFTRTGNLVFDFTAWYQTENRVVADCSQCGKKKEVYRIHGKAKQLRNLVGRKKGTIAMSYYFFCKSCITILEI